MANVTLRIGRRTYDLYSLAKAPDVNGYLPRSTFWQVYNRHRAECVVAGIKTQKIKPKKGKAYWIFTIP